MDKSYINQLYIISFLDAFCIGLTLPVLNNYVITSLNGSHLIIGLLGTLQVLIQSYITSFLNPLTETFGVKNILIFSQLITFLNYIIISITNDCKTFLFFRVLHFIFNHTSYYIVMYTGKFSFKRDRIKAESTFRKLNSYGMILGPLCGGMLYYNDSILSVIFMLNSLTILCLVMATHLLDDQHYPIFKFPSSITTPVMRMGWLDIFDHKVTFPALKILTSISLSSFLMKFTLCLKKNLHANSSLIGFTISFQQIIILFARFNSLLINNFMQNRQNHLKQMLLTCVAVLGTSMYILCTTNCYGTYLLAFVILMISVECFDNLWMKETDPMIKQSMDSLENIFDWLMPLVIGFLCDIWSLLAVQIMALLPLVCAGIVAVMNLENFENKKLKEHKIENDMYADIDFCTKKAQKITIH